jgi:hypothetical protein
MQELSGMPKEQLRTAILLATRDMLHDIVDETWVHLNKSAMRKVCHGSFGEGSTGDYGPFRIYLQMLMCNTAAILHHRMCFLACLNWPRLSICGSCFKQTSLTTCTS